MDVDMLNLSSDLMATASGYCLTTEQLAILPSSLELLKREQGFPRVVYWGKIQAQMGDYLIAQGLGEPGQDKESHKGDIVLASYFEKLKTIPKQTFRLAADGVSWTPLPEATEELLAKNAGFQAALQGKGKVFEPLKGDPAHKFEYTVKPPPPEAGTEPAPDEAREFPEEERLACMVREIDSATCVVPVGAYVLTSDQRVVANNFYTGLPLSQGLNIRSYLHLRPPTKAADPSQLTAMEKPREFLECVGDDVPVSSWSLKHDAPNNLVILRSLLYPGYMHFNIVGSNVYGSAYCGTGLKAWDLAFML